MNGSFYINIITTFSNNFCFIFFSVFITCKSYLSFLFRWIKVAFFNYARSFGFYPKNEYIHFSINNRFLVNFKNAMVSLFYTISCTLQLYRWAWNYNHKFIYLWNYWCNGFSYAIYKILLWRRTIIQFHFLFFKLLG